MEINGKHCSAFKDEVHANSLFDASWLKCIYLVIALEEDETDVLTDDDDDDDDYCTEVSRENLVRPERKRSENQRDDYDDVPPEGTRISDSEEEARRVAAESMAAKQRQEEEEAYEREQLEEGSRREEEERRISRREEEKRRKREEKNLKKAKKERRRAKEEEAAKKALAAAQIKPKRKGVTVDRHLGCYSAGVCAGNGNGWSKVNPIHKS
jgi:hypothetical protein